MLCLTLATSLLLISSAAADVAVQQKMPLSTAVEAVAEVKTWDWGTEFDIILLLLLVYFAGARYGRVLKEHYITFQKLYEEEKVKMGHACSDTTEKLVEEDDVSTVDGSDFSLCPSSDDEAEERSGCVVLRNDMLAMRPAKGMPPKHHLHAQVVESQQDITMLVSPSARWAGLQRDERDWGSLRKSSPEKIEDMEGPFVYLRPAPGLPLPDESTSVDDQSYKKESVVAPIASKKGSLTGSVVGSSLGGGLRPWNKLGGLRPAGALNSRQ